MFLLILDSPSVGEYYIVLKEKAVIGNDMFCVMIRMIYSSKYI